MLTTLESLRRNFNINPKGIVHIGAHNGEESIEYDQMGWYPVVWLEAIPTLAEELKLRLDASKNRVIQALVWSESGVTLEFKVASQTMASSVFSFGTHAKLYPKIQEQSVLKLKSVRLDEILKPEEIIDLVILDIQGAELHALQGLGNRINEVKWIYTEVSKGNLYEGGVRLNELDAFLKSRGFKRSSTRILRGEGWGEALYISKTALELTTSLGKSRAWLADFSFFFSQIVYATRYFLSKLLGRSKN